MLIIGTPAAVSVLEKNGHKTAWQESAADKAAADKAAADVAAKETKAAKEHDAQTAANEAAKVLESTDPNEAKAKPGRKPKDA